MKSRGKETGHKWKTAAGRKQSDEKMQRQRERQSVLYDINVAMTSTLNLREVLDILLEKIDFYLPYSCNTIALLNRKFGEIEPFACRNMNAELWQQGLKASRGLTGRGLTKIVFQSKAPLVVQNIQTDPRVASPEPYRIQGLVSYLGVPLIARGEALGVLSINTKEEYEFTSEEIEFLSTIAGQAAIAIQNSWLYEDVRSSSERLKLLSRQMLQLQESERHHLARELHDEIGQALTSIKINLHSALAMSDKPELGARLHDSSDIIDHAIEQVRNLSHELRPAILDDLGLVPALRWYVDRQAQRGGFRAKLNLEPPKKSPSTEVKTACFRIVQEALTNVIRHSQATKVHIELSQQNNHDLRLAISDNGVGFDINGTKKSAEHGVGFGLESMRERVEILGGDLQLHSAKGMGTRIIASFPHAFIDAPEKGEE